MLSDTSKTICQVRQRNERQAGKASLRKRKLRQSSCKYNTPYLTSILRHVSRFGRRWLLQSVPPMCAARLTFDKLTLRLEDRPIAASTSVLSKAGKPYALRFHRSSSSTAACSMRCSAVQRSARHCRAYAHRPRPDSWPAYLHVLPTCTSVSISPPLHRIANIRCRQGRAYAGIGCDCRFAARPTSCTSDRPAWARGCGWRQAWYRLAREAVCWRGPDIGRGTESW